ncbi:uncharacterized protein PHACADRAFT_106511, partial [Phanerochaete carnosa HHB-10118-sp]
IRSVQPEDTVPLRHAVLWPDKPVSYVLLPEDSAGYHLGAFLDEAEPATAVISLFIESLPLSEPILGPRTAPRTARFRKFACHPSHQGRGIGTALLVSTYQAARDLGCAKQGMQRFGDTFFKGPIEYIRMKAEL